MNIVILGASALATAQHLKALYPQAMIHGLRGRADGAERHYDEFGEHLRTLYREGQPLLALCAAGIVIRSLAALLAEKGAEPPVLALAEDGSAVVPLLGGLADHAPPHVVGRAPVENFLQGTATTEALLMFIQAALAPTG